MAFNYYLPVLFNLVFLLSLFFLASVYKKIFYYDLYCSLADIRQKLFSLKESRSISSSLFTYISSTCDLLSVVSLLPSQEHRMKLSLLLYDVSELLHSARCMDSMRLFHLVQSVISDFLDCAKYHVFFLVLSFLVYLFYSFLVISFYIKFY